MDSRAGMVQDERMNGRISRLFALLIAGLPGLMAQAQPIVPARIDARMMRQPAVSATQIAFVYAGDIWLADKAGGVALRISSPKGEESFPRFSPDGSLLAFTGDYDGNEDLYVMPVTGGLPTRVTHHGAPDRMLGWYPDGQNILYATSMTSPKYVPSASSQPMTNEQAGRAIRLPYFRELLTVSKTISSCCVTAIPTRADCGLPSRAPTAGSSRRGSGQSRGNPRT
jgi:dipeptidyl aminopeptidase/acylaminoacyl peptidase